jgi:hypothetical protein
MDGQLSQAIADAEMAIRSADRGDSLRFHGLAGLALAEALHAVGRHVDATAAAQDALDRFERKGATALAAEP